MRAKKQQPGNPVKDVANAIGGIAADKFPTIGEEQQQIIAEMTAVETEQPAGAFEIVPGMTVEEMTAMFFNEALLEPPYKVWQLNSKGYRYYYRYDEHGQPEFYPSVTTVLSQTMPKSPHLIQWIANKGIEEAERYKNERAAYGTFMHAAFEKLLIERAYDLDNLKAELKIYIEYQRLPDDFIYYADDLKKDMLAFAQFILDYDVKPLAVEIALVHPHYNYAGMIDCPCTMLAKPGSPERINAIVDFKSGRKGFYEEAEVQLHLYRMMWNVNFEHLQIDKVFNFSPKDWRKKPTYNLKDQTNSPNAAKIPALLDIAAIEDGKRDNIFTSVSGQINLDAAPDLTENVVSLTLAELIKKKAPKDKQEPKGAKPISKASLKAEQVQEPTAAPEPKTTKKTATVKRTKAATPKAAVKAPKTAKVAKKPTGKVIAPTKEQKPVKTAKTAAKQNLLNDEPEI